jgi:hypothetical protein
MQLYPNCILDFLRIKFKVIAFFPGLLKEGESNLGSFLQPDSEGGPARKFGKLGWL